MIAKDLGRIQFTEGDSHDCSCCEDAFEYWLEKHPGAEVLNVSDSWNGSIHIIVVYYSKSSLKRIFPIGS